MAAYIDYLWWELVLLTGAKVLVGSSAVVVEVHKLAGVYTCAQHEMGWPCNCCGTFKAYTFERNAVWTSMAAR